MYLGEVQATLESILNNVDLTQNFGKIGRLQCFIYWTANRNKLVIIINTFTIHTRLGFEKLFADSI